MKRTFLRTVLLVVLLLLAVVLGQVIGEACGNISFLSWLAINVQFGLNPTVINLHVIELTFGIVVNFMWHRPSSFYLPLSPTAVLKLPINSHFFHGQNVSSGHSVHNFCSGLFLAVNSDKIYIKP